MYGLLGSTRSGQAGTVDEKSGVASRVRRETVVASEIFRRSKRIASQRPLA